MTREQMIYQCLEKLPYPVSFYDKLSEGSLYSVWHKHVELGIPIDKRQQKYKASNDKARQQEASKKAQKQPKQQEYQQMDIFSYMAEQEKKKDKEPISATEFARRSLNRGEINMITIHIFGEAVCHEIVDNNLTVEEYYSLLSSNVDDTPTIYYNENDGCYYRRTDCCGYILMTDSEVEELDIANLSIGLISDRDAEQGPKLVKKPGK